MSVSALASIDGGDAVAPPRHVAIIMDGNGRWAAHKGVSRSKGHRRGADAVRKAIEGAGQTGVEFLTLYAFSSENWNRPADEVTDLMGLLRMYLSREIKTLHKEGVRLRVIGNRETLSADICNMIDKAEALTGGNTRLNLVIALSYGAREEITSAVKTLTKDVASGAIEPENITEQMISERLYTKDIPDPDLIIRTSGEQRLSNFLMWQAAYSEFLFMPVLWPDFDQASFAEAVEAYKGRDRRFGARP